MWKGRRDTRGCVTRLTGTQEHCRAGIYASKAKNWEDGSVAGDR